MGGISGSVIRLFFAGSIWVRFEFAFGLSENSGCGRCIMGVLYIVGGTLQSQLIPCSR